MPGLPSLLNGLVAWWDMRQEVDLGHRLMDLSGNNRHLDTEGSIFDSANNMNWGERDADEYEDSTFGKAVRANYLYRLDETAFRLAEGSWAISFWFRILPELYDAGVPVNIVWKGASPATIDYRIWWAAGRINYEFADVFIVPASSGGIFPVDSWHHAVVWRDKANDILSAFIDGGAVLPASNTNAVGGVNSPYPLLIGNSTARTPHTPFLAELAIWNRSLIPGELAWLWNNGVRRSYSEINPTSITDDCPSQECCPPSTWNKASECNPQDASVAVTTPAPCLVMADVFSDPPPQSKVIFPIWVRLYSDQDLAVIRYTTDGTEPVATSPQYTGPIQVLEASTQIRARAFLAGCPDGEVRVFQWMTANAEYQFCYKGQSGDNVGQWGVFSGNGTTDLRWFFEIVNAASEVKLDRIELYQMDANLRWTTGQAWSTAEFITPPFPEWDQSETFHVFPLVVFDAFPSQLNDNYADPAYFEIGELPDGTYNFYGDPVVPPANYFLLILYPAGGQPIRMFTDTSICDDPPPCPPLSPPALDALCSRIEIEMAMPGAAKPWQLYVASCDDSAGFQLLASGTNSGLIANSHTGLVAGCQYCYYWRINWTGDATNDHCGWVSSPINCATPTCEPSASLAGPDQVCVGDPFNLGYVTDCAVSDVTLELVSGVPGDIDVAFPITLDPNTSGTVVVTPSATGSWTFRLTAPAIAAGCSADIAEWIVQAVSVPLITDNCSAPVLCTITHMRQAAATPLTPMDTTIIKAVHLPTDSPVCFFNLGGPVCETPGVPFPSLINAVWDFKFLHFGGCEWKMLGAEVAIGWPDVSQPNPSGTALAINDPEEPTFYYFFSPGSMAGTSIFPAFDDYWVLTITAKLLCTGIATPLACWGSGAAFLWRGFKDCSNGPLGEYISDRYFGALPVEAGGIASRPENAHIYSLLVK